MTDLLIDLAASGTVVLLALVMTGAVEMTARFLARSRFRDGE